MLYIIRHGENNWNKNGRVQGHSDIVLNETGKKQAEIMKEKLKDVEFDEVFSSPLKRAYETASIITDHKIRIDERIIERCNGILEGTTPEERIKILEKEKVDWHNPNKENSLGIESTDLLQERVDSFLKDINDNYKGKNVLIVTHAGVIINMRITLEGEVDDILKYNLGNCEVFMYNNN